jgi:hypothetical protein
MVPHVEIVPCTNSIPIVISWHPIYLPRLDHAVTRVHTLCKCDLKILETSLWNFASSKLLKDFHNLLSEIVAFELPALIFYVEKEFPVHLCVECEDNMEMSKSRQHDEAHNVPFDLQREGV